MWIQIFLDLLWRQPTLQPYLPYSWSLPILEHQYIIARLFLVLKHYHNNLIKLQYTFLTINSSSCLNYSLFFIFYTWFMISCNLDCFPSSILIPTNYSSWISYICCPHLLFLDKNCDGSRSWEWCISFWVPNILISLFKCFHNCFIFILIFK